MNAQPENKTTVGNAPQAKLYQQIARIVEARLNCIERGNDWSLKHEDTLSEINDLLPSGSGIDTGTKIDLDESKPNRLVFNFSYHHMNDDGMYDGWTDHQVIVTPSLSFGFDLRISGRNRNDVKDYLHEVYQSALSEIVDFDKEKQCYFLPSMRQAAAEFQHKVATGEIV